MKFVLLLAAPIALAFATAPASAQDRVVQSHVAVQHDVHVTHSDDNAPPPRHGWHMKRVCKVRWTNHHRISRCRTVRVHW